MTIKTIKRITCDDTGKTYEIVDGKPDSSVPQLWEIEVRFRDLRFPSCAAEGTPVTIEKLIVERQLLVDIGLVPVLWKDRPRSCRSTRDVLIELLSKVVVVPCNIESIS